MLQKTPIGIFDSGYGGLTVMKEIVARLPEFDYLYLGDNARAPYGNRSFETVYQYTLQCIKWFFSKGCPLIIVACNTASAKALRTIQQKDLPNLAPQNRILGVIRPTAEVIGNYSVTGKVGLMATTGTVSSQSYVLEAAKFFPQLKLFQQACPLLVPLIENNEFENEGSDFFIKKYVNELMSQSQEIDTVLLACTHYPILYHPIRQCLPDHVTLLAQGPIVAESLLDYLGRHVDMKAKISKNGGREFYTTDDAKGFDKQALLFWGAEIHAKEASVLV
jgi:glutamate racemase